MIAEETLFVIDIHAEGDCTVVFQEIFTALDIPFSITHNTESGNSKCRVYCQSEEEASDETDKIKQEVEKWRETLPIPTLSFTRQSITENEWVDKWKDNFHTFKPSPHIVVKPTWENYIPNDNEFVLELDPGMCFGTGYHGTTQACIDFLDTLSSELGTVPLLDAGCGSGILSMAALKLGYRPIYAFDNDKDAVDITRKHLGEFSKQNYNVIHSELQNYEPPHSFPLVAANILAPVLIENAEQLVSFLDDSNDSESYLILSGILIKQYPEVKEVFEGLGLKEVETKVIDNWKSGCFVR